jgi:hypothetical protein
MGRTEGRYWTAQRGPLKAGAVVSVWTVAEAALDCGAALASSVTLFTVGGWRLRHQRRANTSIVGGESNDYDSHRDHDTVAAPMKTPPGE